MQSAGYFVVMLSRLLFSHKVYIFHIALRKSKLRIKSLTSKTNKLVELSLLRSLEVRCLLFNILKVKIFEITICSSNGDLHFSSQFNL